MEKVKQLKILSTAKFAAVIGGFAGLGAGILYSFGGLIIDTLVSIGWITTTETPGLSFGTVLAFGALIGMPLIFAVFGFVAGMVGAYLYNKTSKWFGGIKINIKG